MEKKEEKIELKRTEEVQEIVDRMPVRGARWVVLIVVGLAAAMLLFGFVIRYPEVVTGTMTVTMRTAPVKLVASASGQLKLRGRLPRLPVEGDVIFAVIDNATDTDDFLLADSLLARFRLAAGDSCRRSFPDNLNLGELNGAYYQFVSVHDIYMNYLDGNTYVTKENSCRLQLLSCEKSLSFYEEKLRIKGEQLGFYRREVSRDSILLKIGDFIERELDRTKNAYNGMLETYNSILENMALLQIQSRELKNQLAQLALERRDYECKLRMDLTTAHNALQAGVKQWKDRYAFIAPFRGCVEFLGFWRENDYIAPGTEVFSVVPAESPVVGHLLLPSQGAGKVKPGQTVTIRLDDYPYLEYGVVEGCVQEISLVTKPVVSAAEQTADTYLVTIGLPSGLKTKFGSSLDFRYEIKGTADVQTEKRRLIERLFDNLKYITNQ